MQRRNLKWVWGLILMGVVLVAVLNLHWITYVLHLARHQVSVVFDKKNISEILLRSNLESGLRKKLELTLQIRAYVENKYQMQNSQSYLTLHDIGRNYLGYNITVTGEFSLEPEAFSFWPIGSFQYLGFFNKDLAEVWAAKYRARGFEVYLSEIGGYSTLGWFKDPLFSTQLKWSDYALARLIGHEIAHEKLYISGDTEFNEMLASFIERKIARDFSIFKGENPLLFSPAQQKKNTALVKDFFSHVLETRKELEHIYAMPITDNEKRIQKYEQMQKLQTWLHANKKQLSFIHVAHELMDAARLTNAMLVQFHRYNPQSVAFEIVFEKCTGNYPCWFEAISVLEKCSRDMRREWVKKDRTKYADPKSFCK